MSQWCIGVESAAATGAQDACLEPSAIATLVDHDDNDYHDTSKRVHHQLDVYKRDHLLNTVAANGHDNDN